MDILGIGKRVHLFKESLPFVAYNYVNGPFLHMWVRYGYDPTKDPLSRIYQLVICRTEQKTLKKISEKISRFIGKDASKDKIVDLSDMVVRPLPADHFSSLLNKGASGRLPITLFGSICKCQISFQLHTLASEEIFAFISNLPVESSCNESSGWYSDAAISQIRNFMIGYIGRKADEFLQQSEVQFAASDGSSAEESYVFSERMKLMQSIIERGESTPLSRNISENEASVRRLAHWIHKYLEHARKIPVSASCGLSQNTVAAMFAMSAMTPKLPAPAFYDSQRLIPKEKELRSSSSSMIAADVDEPTRKKADPKVAPLSVRSEVHVNPRVLHPQSSVDFRAVDAYKIFTQGDSDSEGSN